MTINPAPEEFALMTQRARAMWALGDFARAGAEQVIVGELLCRAIDIHPGERVLDVAAGSGNAALAAARRGARVTATDFVPQLLQVAARRAAVEGLVVDTEEADAQALPFPDGAFDVVLSTFGVMFAPDQARAASELVRVCRPAGRIGLTAWTPRSVMASAQATAGRFAPFPPIPGARSPIEWGTEARVRELLGSGVTDLERAGTDHRHVRRLARRARRIQPHLRRPHQGDLRPPRPRRATGPRRRTRRLPAAVQPRHRRDTRSPPPNTSRSSPQKHPDRRHSRATQSD